MTIEYRKAVESINQMINTKVIDNVFKASTILAYLFDLTKEKTMEDLIALRKSRF